MRMHRVEYVYAGDELIETIQHDVDWPSLRAFRKRVLSKLDEWYLKDRWDSGS